MRTLDDLQGAFALLEREADEYAASHEILVASADVITLSAAPSRRRRVRPALWLTAAAVAAAATAGTFVAIDTAGSRGHAVGGKHETKWISASRLELPVVIPDSLGYKLVESLASPDGQSLELVNQSSRIDLSVGPPSDHVPDPAARTAVDVNGATGYYLDENLVPHPGQTPLATTSTGPDYGAQFGRALYWRSPTTGGWLTLQTQGAPASEQVLLRVARGIRVSGTTPVRSDFSLRQAPSGMRLAAVDGIYRQVSDEPPFDLEAPGWETYVEYAATDGGDGITVSVNSANGRGYTEPSDPTGKWAGMSVGPWTKGATAVTVGGWKGFWDGTKHSLSLKAADDAYVNIQETGAWNSAPSMPLERLTAVARSVTVVPHPEDRSTWLDASKALPIGG